MSRNLSTHLPLAALLSVAISTTATAAQFGAPRMMPSAASTLLVDADGTYRGVGDGSRLDRNADGSWSKTRIPSASFGSAIALNRRGDVFTAGDDGLADGEFVVTSTPAGGLPHRDVLTPRPDRVNNRSVGLALAIGGNGDAAVAWVAGDRLQVATRAGLDGLWSPPAVLGSPGARPIALVVNSAGAAMLVLSQPADVGQSLMSSRKTSSGGAWSAPVPLGQVSSMRRLELDLDVAGRASAVWVDKRLVLTSTNEPGTDTWSLPESLGPGSNPSLDLSESGHGIVAWVTPTGVDGPSSRILSRRRPAGGMSWDGPQQVSDALVEASFPHTSIADDGAAIVAWWRATKPMDFRLVPTPQATVAAAGAPFTSGRDIAPMSNVEFTQSLTTAIADANHAGIAWSTSDGGGAGTIPWFAEYSSTAVPPPASRLRITSLSNSTSAAAGSITRFHVDTNVEVERLPAALLEQRIGGRWVLVRRLPSSTPMIPVRLGGPGRYRFRVRLLGAQSTRTGEMTMTATRAAERIGVPCLIPLSATGEANDVWVACQREHDASVFLRRFDPRTGAGRGPEITVGTNTFGEPWFQAFAHDARRVWILRDTTLASIDRRTGRRFPDVKIDDLGLGPGRLIAAGATGVAIFDPSNDRLIRLNRDGKITARLELPVDSQAGASLAIGPSGVWISTRSSDGSTTHTRVDRTNRVTHVPARGLVSGGHLGVWELRPGRVRRLDPPAPPLPGIVRGDRLFDLEVGPDALWVTELVHNGGVRVARVNPRSGHVTGRWTLPELAPLLPLNGAAWAVTRSGLIELR